MSNAVFTTIYLLGQLQGRHGHIHLSGVQRLRLKFLESDEPLVIGGVFCLLGLIIVAFEH